MTQEEPKEGKLFESVEQLSKIAQDLVRRKTEQKPLKWCSQCGHKCPLPPQHTWVGLTDEEIDVIDEATWDEDHKSWGIHDFARAIEAKLKEKNGA